MDERLRFFIEHLKKRRVVHNFADFASEMGKTRSVISEMINGKRVISEQFVQDIANKYPQLNMDWLLTGEGEMIKSEAQQSAKGDNTIQVSGTNVDLRNINQSKGSNDDAKRIKEMEQRIAELTKDKERLQNLVDKMQAQISTLLEKI